MATGAGKAGRSNEDFAGAVPGAAVLLDGAGIPGTESLCLHGVAWYTHRLGGALLGRLSRDDGGDLAAILAAAIGEIAAEHRGTCDITNVSSPQATVAIVRLTEGRLDHLLLADSFLLLDQVRGGPRVITDERETTIRRICTSPLDGVPGRQTMRTMSDAEVRAFLQHGTRTAKVATDAPDGHPHVVPVWFVLDGDDLVVTTMSSSAKARHLARDPRVAVTVDDERPPFAFVYLRGTATLHPNPPDLLDWTTRVAGRYLGVADAAEAGRRYAAIDDLIVRIRIERITGRAEVSA